MGSNLEEENNKQEWKEDKRKQQWDNVIII